MSSESAEERKIMKGDPPKARKKKNPDADMPFLDHLEEFRWRIIKGLIGIALGVVLAFIFSHFVINEILLGPTHKDFIVYQWLHIHAVDVILQSRKLPGQFFTYWGTLIVMGAIAGSPVFFFQMYAFIQPAMGKSSKRKTRGIVFLITILFIIGIAFGYLVLTPFALQFFTQFRISDVIQNFFDVNEYFSSLAMWVLACGIIFQLPTVVYFLSKIGLLTPDFLIKYRRHAIVVCFVLGAALTPPDPLSQALVAVPLIGLYQISIIISRITVKRRNKEIFGDKNGPGGAQKT